MSGRTLAIPLLLWAAGCHVLLPFGSPGSADAGRGGDTHAEAGHSLERGSVPADRKLIDQRRTEAGAKKDTGCGPVLPLSLQPTPVPQTLLDAKSDFNLKTTQLNGYLADIRAYQVPSCLKAPTGLGEITPLTLGDIQGLSFEAGQILPRATLIGSLLFGTQYSLGGPALLQAADDFGGAPVAEAWCGGTEIACRNCHDYRVACVLYYPVSRRVLRIDGGHIVDG